MKTIAIEKIDLGALGQEVSKYENQWIAISDENKIVSSGKTYSEAVRGIAENQNAALFKVPRLDAFLAP